MSAVPALALYNTTERSRVGHRLALGLQCIDAVTRLPVAPLPGGVVAAELLAIGTRPWVQRFEPHTQSRQALRWAGRYQRLLQRAVEQADPVSHEVRVGGLRDARQAGSVHRQDPRCFVPRRLSIEPALDAAGVPRANADNLRTVWLWPGAAYPVPARSTGVRGQVLRDLGGGRQAPVPWVRVICTRPGAGAPDLATEAVLGWAHGDDRGEFLLLLGAGAVPAGGDLPARVDVRLWVCLPPPLPVFDPHDPLASLPLESAGSEAFNDVLSGQTLPPSHVPQAPRDLSVHLGQVHVMPPADLLF